MREPKRSMRSNAVLPIAYDPRTSDQEKCSNDPRIELADKIKKGQLKTGKLGVCQATMADLWNAALAA